MRVSPLTSEHIIAQIRLHAIFWALCLPRLEDGGSTADLEGNALKGWWHVHHAEQGHYLFGWNPLGLVGLQYCSYEDYDGQAREPPAKRKPGS